MRYLFVYDDAIDARFARSLAALFTEDCSSDNPAERVTAALFFTVDVIRSNLDNHALRPVAERVAARCAASVNWKYWATSGRPVPAIPKLSFSRQNLLEFVFMRYARLLPDVDESGERFIGIDFHGIYNELYTVRRPPIVISGREPATEPGRPLLRFSFSRLFGEVGAGQRETILSALRSRSVSQFAT